MLRRFNIFKILVNHFFIWDLWFLVLVNVVKKLSNLITLDLFTELLIKITKLIGNKLKDLDIDWLG